MFFAFLNFSGYAQNTVIKHYGVSEGLPSSECYWITQDSKGYMWIATDAGVVKYDGYKFKIYNSSKGLPDNTVFKIHEDKYGKIWFATYSGQMAWYSHKDDSIYGISGNKRLSDMVKIVPTDFAFDDHDTLFISAARYGYLKLYPPLYDSVKPYHYDRSCFYIREVGNKGFIYGNCYDYKIARLQSMPLFFEDKSGKRLGDFLSLTPDVSATSAVRIAPGKFMFCDYKSISEISAKSKKVVLDSLPFKNSGIITIYRDHLSRIWANTFNAGTFLYDSLTQKGPPKRFLQNASVTSVYEDSDNGIWLTTLEDGVYYIPSLEFRFMDNTPGSTSHKVFSIDVYDNKLSYLNSDGYLTQIDIGTGELLNKFKTAYSSFYILRSGKKLLVCSTVAFFLDENNKNELLSANLSESPTGRLRLKKAIEFDQDHLLGFFDGSLVKINKVSGQCRILLKGLSTIFSIHRQGNLVWIGTKKGLYSYSNNRLVYYGDKSPLLKNRVECMANDGNRLFLGIRGYGVYIYENNKIQQQYTEANGLASNLCKSMIKDSLGNIWIGTNRGISRLRKETGSNYVVNTIDLTNGLISGEINQLAIYHGKLYFATNEGVGMVNISDAFNSLVSIPVYIEDFAVNNMRMDFSAKHILKHDENFIKINYKGVYARAEGDIKYKYRLEGLDTNWTYSKNTYVQFTTLPPGEYKFVVYAINQDGRLSNRPEAISFIIQKPFWKTWWFYLLTGIVFFIIIYLLYDSRVRFIKQQEKEKSEISKRIAESELKALRAQMNPHFMFNAINSIQNFVLKNDSRSAQKYLTKFARLIRSVLENSKHELVWLNKEVEALELYIELEALRASFSFDYEVVIEDSLNAVNLFIPPMIIQPYIENAILHGIIPLTERRGKLQIKFSQEGSLLKCVIDDNGIGRAMAHEIRLRKQQSHQSMGMNVTQDRITILNQHTPNLLASVIVLDKLVDGVAMGTTVEISINIKKSQNG